MRGYFRLISPGWISFMLLYNGFINPFFFTAFALFQELNPYQNGIVFIHSYDCFSNIEENMRMCIVSSNPYSICAIINTKKANCEHSRVGVL